MILKLVVIAVVAMTAGIVQGVCGFGSGPINMMFLPLLMPIPQAAGINSVFCIPSTLTIVLRYKNSFKLKKCCIQTLIYLFVSSATVLLFKNFNGTVLNRIFGGFLLLLAIYNFFLSNKQLKQWSKWKMIACFVGAGICSGLFSIGGPLVSLYYISNSKNKEEYLASTQFVFFWNVIFTTITRISGGILRKEHIIMMIPGILGMLLGVNIASYFVNKINSENLKKIIYSAIGISGLGYLLG